MPWFFHRSPSLEAQHTPSAIRQRIQGATQHSYLGDFVLGAIDGAVTTFAVVAGVAGAGYSGTVAIVLGVANLLADGFSMAAGNYLGTESNRQMVERMRSVEEQHIDQVPEAEREEIRVIYAGKGFEGELLEEIVDVITDDRRRWVDAMLTDEWGLQLDTPSPLKAGATTFAAFLLAGFVPLLPFCLPMELTPSQLFGFSTLATALTFILVGLAKGIVVQRGLLLSMAETLLIGGGAASLAYLMGHWLQKLVEG